MTKKHFIAIAAIIREARFLGMESHTMLKRAGFNEACNYIEDSLCNEFQKANPNFDRARFKAACEAKMDTGNRTPARGLGR